MISSLLTLLFAIVAVLYISFETKKKLPIKHGIYWLVIALVLPLIATYISHIVGGNTGNFLLHMIGGGMSATCLFYYLYGLTGAVYNWRIEFITLFAFVSCLGIFNELFEYAIELTTSLTMSLDSQDTWRDFVANSLGMLVAYLSIKIIVWVRASKKQG